MNVESWHFDWEVDMVGRYLVFVGSCNRPTPYFASSNGSGVAVLALDAATFHAEPVCSYSDIENPTYLSVRHDGRAIYATSEVFGWKEGLVTSFAFDPFERNIEYLNTQPTLGSIAAQSAISKDSKNLLLVNYGMESGGPDQSLVIYPFTNELGLLPAADSVRQIGKGPDPVRQERSHAHSVTEIGENTYVVADLGCDTLTTYRLDDRGRLSKQSILQCPPGSGPRHIAVHPGGQYLFVMNELNSTCASFAIERERGSLSAINVVEATPINPDVENHCADIQISPDGLFLYGSNRGHDSISVYSIEQATGRVGLVGTIPCGGKTPRNLAMSPDGSLLFCANQDSDRINIFERDASDGSLRDMGHYIEIGTPTCVKVIDTRM